KSKKDEWKEIGEWVCQLQREEWQEQSHGVWTTRGGKVVRWPYPSVWQQAPTVELLQPSLNRVGLRLPKMTVEKEPLLRVVPGRLWAGGKYDIGLMATAQPVVVTPKSDYRPKKMQYPLKPEAVAGITPVFNSLRQAGVIIPCPDSPVRTPIFPVKKIRGPGEPDEWRFVQDLQAVNAAIHPRAPEVPNPHTILTQIPPEAQWFSVIDLANAFFSIPVDPDSQYWFAFSFQGRMWTWTRLPQGYAESPTVYNAALRDNLDGFSFPCGSTLLQYVDDLMVCSATQEQCQEDTLALLVYLAGQGHKASLTKLQFVKPSVQYLGHIITGEGKRLDPERIQAILDIPKPKTKKQMMSFLGMTSYCRQWIPNYSELEGPLLAITHGKGLGAHDKVDWTTEAEESFSKLKQSLTQAPTLGLRDPNRPFTQTCDEKQGYMTSVLTQEHGGKMRPVAYFSCKLDSVAQGLPTCLRAVAAAERAVLAS
ncbi:hypothetical protein NFI96_009151, partial [Prochilodus magdalenae]